MKKPLMIPNPILSHTKSFNSPLEDLNGTQRFAQAPTFLKNSNFKQSMTDQNRRKVQKRNIQLLRLFKPIQQKQFKLTMLQNSPYMRTNQIFNYLVNKLKKQRHGMINVEIEEEKKKSPKPIQNRIRQFLFHSLQQAILMPECQMKQTKFLERLFDWFTDVFKERQMKLGFKIQKNQEKTDDSMDQDWIIRNTYKSNLPLEIKQFQRKILNVGQLSNIDKNDLKSKSFNQTTDKFSKQQSKLQRDLSETGETKKFTLSSINNLPNSKSVELLPVLKARAYMSKLVRNREQKQNMELKAHEQEWKKSKAQMLQHSAKKYLQSLQKNNTTSGQSFEEKQKYRRGKRSDRNYSLGTKVIQKIQAARLGVTCTQFRKNKDNIIKENKTQTYDSPVFHPYLTSSYFHDIKKKRLETLQKYSFPNLLEKQITQTEQSEDLNGKNQERSEFDNQEQKYCQMLFADKSEEDEQLESVDGLGLSVLITEKKEKAKKK